MTSSVKGSCLCGGVAFEISGKTSPIGQCHCSKCRKVSGTDGNAVLITRVDNLTWLRGEDLVRKYFVPNGDGWCSSFCGTCGSPTPHTDNASKIYFVPAGLLDDDPGVKPRLHVFTSSKAPWWTIDDGLPQHPKWVPGFEPKKPAR